MHLNSGQPVRVFDFEADQYRRQMAREREKIAARLDTIERQQRDMNNQLTLITHQLDTVDNHLVANLMTAKATPEARSAWGKGAKRDGDAR